ncbi:hypothetical protein K8I85_11595, partial [bacterium]|nr:hypothetical protein [bacterium]
MNPFPAVTRAEWEAAAAKALEGGPAAARWNRFVDDGVTVRPLHTERPGDAAARWAPSARPVNMALTEPATDDGFPRDVAEDARGGVRA